MLRGLASTGGVAAAAAAAASLRAGLLSGGGAECVPYQGPKQTKVRTQGFPLVAHHHGKAKVRVLKVRHEALGGGREQHSVSEYTVHTRLYSPEYAKVYTNDDNADLVATDTQKNAVYVVAKRTAAETPEQFGLDLARHFLDTYPILTACQIDVDETLWTRVHAAGEEPHDHAFVKQAPEQSGATVELARGDQGLAQAQVTSAIKGLVILKTTQSGFAGYQKDALTLLPDCDDRCLATELSAEWSYGSKVVDFAAARVAVKKELVKGLFGPANGGVFSASLQATIYDAACLCLAAVPELARIAISTPNLHYLPTTQQLKALGVVADTTYVRDVFIPTSEPSGTIRCEVAREGAR